MTTVEFGGVTFDDEASTGFSLSKLVGWYDSAPARYQADSRPQANGSFRPGTIYRDPRVVSVEGSWSGDSLADAYEARDTLAGLMADGQETTFTVTDPVDTRWCSVGLSTAPTMDDGLYQPFFKFAFDVIAADPFRYSVPVAASTGVPSASSGLVWPLGVQGDSAPTQGLYPATYYPKDPVNPGFYLTDGLTANGDGTYQPNAIVPTGKFFDWGTPGSTGRVLAVNDGSAETASVLEVTGGLSQGFELTWVPTGQRVRFERPVDVSETVRLSPRTGRVTISGSDVTGFLTASEWWTVPAKRAGEIQFTPLGTVTGTPTLTARTASAYV
jgi:hypothetical protein